MNSVVIKRDKSSYSESESYKALRTNLQFCGGDKKIIAITSCMPNEGKSSVAMELAISLTENEKKVLLLDADLRKSIMVGKVKVTHSVKGLTHYLAKQATLMDVVNATDIPGLHVIFAGPFPPNPAELLDSKYFKGMVSSIKNIYDYIIIDTPPLGSVIDSAVVAKECDGVVLVIESGVIRYRFAQNVKEQMEKSGCPILGVVLNKVDMTQKGYYGKYYGKYGAYGD